MSRAFDKINRTDCYGLRMLTSSNKKEDDNDNVNDKEEEGEEDGNTNIKKKTRAIAHKFVS